MQLSVCFIVFFVYLSSDGVTPCSGKGWLNWCQQPTYLLNLLFFQPPFLYLGHVRTATHRKKTEAIYIFFRHLMLLLLSSLLSFQVFLTPNNLNSAVITLKTVNVRTKKTSLCQPRLLSYFKNKRDQGIKRMIDLSIHTHNLFVVFCYQIFIWVQINIFI